MKLKQIQKTLFLGIACVSIGLMAASPATANLISDPGFNDAAGGSGSWGKWGAVDFNNWGGNLPEWWGASTAFYANTEGNSGGIFDWDIAGQAGASYDFNVDLWVQDAFDATIVVGMEYMAADNNTVLGSDLLTLTAANVYISDGSEAEEWMRWRNYSVSGSATPAGTEFIRPFVRYENVTAASNQWFFADNATLTPEPSALVLLTTGLVLVLRRRK